jgi:L-seryl-tRNA(Ser) seleniumtransferase
VPNRTRQPDALRTLPSVDELARAVGPTNHTHERIVAASRLIIEQARADILASPNPTTTPTLDHLAEQTRELLRRAATPPLQPAINASGILIHTGLGRSPIAPEAAEAMRAVAAANAPVELDLASGARNKRADLIRPLIAELTGAESATAVNNNAAAMLLVLSTFATGRAVIVSRGELVEIGGSYRLPEVIEAGGATLREVGTTNKTRLADYERALRTGEPTDIGAILKVHTSNFRIEGFTADVPIADLAKLARDHAVPVIHDTGSGVLRRRENDRLPESEPDAASSIAAGADLVLFSGDKLLGGPQCGLIAGRRELIERIEKNPLMRALRLDKTALAALAVTLQLHRDDDNRIPILRMWRTPIDGLRTRAAALIDRLQHIDTLDAELIETTAYIGGGAAPAEGRPSVAIALRSTRFNETDFTARLRTGVPAIVPRIEDARVILDLLAVDPADDDAVITAIRATCAPSA